MEALFLRYFAIIVFSCTWAKVQAAPFENSTKGLPEVTPSKEVYLKHGDVYVMTAAPAKQKIKNKWVWRLAYNQMIPGPLLRVDQGATVRVILKNELPIDTTLHPHGLRGDPKYDGIPGIGQPPIKPGSSYEYVLQFIDYGMYWYHPHIRDDFTADSGLYGAIIVNPKPENAWSANAKEIPIILDDIDLSKGGTTYFKDMTTHTLMGRYGTSNLVNGAIMPHINVESGSSLRFFVLNAANTRAFRFAIPGLQLAVVGSDLGRMQKKEEVDAVVIGPGERYIIEATAPTKPSTLNILNQKPKAETMAYLRVLAAQAKQSLPSTRPNTKDEKEVFTKEDLKRFEKKMSEPIDFNLRLTLTMDHSKLPMTMTSSHHHSEKEKVAGVQTFYHQGRLTGVEWDDDMATMNKKSSDQNVTWQMIDEADGKMNMAINWSLKKNKLYRIRINNTKDSMHPMQHPIHFHGQRFIVMNVNGVPNPNIAWKDTVLLGTGDVADLLLEATHTGTWMAHCHILEHLGAGMMMGFSVQN